jgi:hypothetical protein
MTKYWVNIIPKERVEKAMKEGVMESKGDEAHLARLKEGDWVVFYSPRTDIAGTTKLQTFTAIGQVKDSNIESTFEDGVKVFRRKVEYTPTVETSLIPLIQPLSFIRNKKHWGFIFKFSLVEIPETDFQLISEKMIQKT